MFLLVYLKKNHSLRPEGGLAIPSRNLFLVASEDDDRSKNVRGSISIYYKNYAGTAYPFIMSEDRDRKPGIPIPFGGLSSLTTGKCRTQVRVRSFCYLHIVHVACRFKTENLTFTGIILTFSLLLLLLWFQFTGRV
jgi:hypothetical protein